MGSEGLERRGKRCRDSFHTINDTFQQKGLLVKNIIFSETEKYLL